MRLNVILVDDEPLARKLVSNLLKKIPEMRVIGAYGTGKEAIKAINLQQPDVLFLDIQLKDMTGFDILEKIHVKIPLTVFTTAYDSYAIEAFNIFAFDYLLKPFTEERFYKSVFRVVEQFENKKSTALQDKLSQLLNHVHSEGLTKANGIKSRIPVPSGSKTVFVDKGDINCILASNYYIDIYTANAKFVLRSSMYTILKELDPQIFVRIHRSSIINLNCIEELITSAFGELDVKMRGGRQLRVSKGYRKQFLIKMGLAK